MIIAMLQDKISLLKMISAYGDKGKVHRKKSKKNLTSVSFMYVCVAENVELLVFFLLFFAPSP